MFNAINQSEAQHKIKFSGNELFLVYKPAVFYQIRMTLIVKVRSAVQLCAFCERPGGAGGGSGVVHMWQRGRGQRALGTSSFNSDSPAS